MYTKLESSVMLVLLKQAVLLSAVISVSLGQTVTVSMEPKYYSDPATDSATMTCDFSVDDATYTFFDLEWSIDGDVVADFFNNAADPAYRGYCSSSSNCNISRNSSKSYFTISSLDMTSNNKTFGCRVIFQSGAQTRNGQDTALLEVVVPITTIVMLNGSSSESFTDGDEVDLSLGVASHIFQCEVAKINPLATFTWTVGGNQLSSDNIINNHVVDMVTRLTMSTSKAALKPDQDYNDQDLICEAKNYEGDPGVTFRLLLKVADPCDGVMCENGGTCGIDPNDPSKWVCDCTDKFEGVLCGTDVTPPSGPPLGIGAIIGIVIGAIIVVLIIGVVAFCLCKR